MALGTVRVMRTTGMMGEVVGMAASVATRHTTNPRGVYKNYLNELKSLMEKVWANTMLKICSNTTKVQLSVLENERTQLANGLLQFQQCTPNL